MPPPRIAFYPLSRTARRITFKFQTHDVRTYLFEDAVQRARRAVTRAGGTLLGGVHAPPKHIKRWCVNRSPHVNSKSKEHFWMVSHRRVFRWDAPANVDHQAPDYIAMAMPDSVAMRVQNERPGLMCLQDMWQTMREAEKGTAVPQEMDSEESPE